MSTGIAKRRYQQLEMARMPFLTRAREAAELTIPALVPPEGHTGFNDLPTPYQALGARGVNNLASKLLLSLLPPNSPFFRLTIDDFTLKELTERDGMRAEVEKGLNRIERAIQNKIETEALRVGIFEALKQLLVAGNVLIFLPSEGGIRVFQLSRYVIQRDPMGNVLEIITKESVSPDVLEPKLRLLVQEEQKGDTNGSTEKTLDLYTRVTREGKKWVYRQEINGIYVPDSHGTVPLDRTPWLPLRFTTIDGEDYGRGFVEEYIGDLSSLEDLSKAIVEGAGQAARVLYLTNPNGVTAEEDIAQADNGAVVTGREEDVHVLQLNKYADFRVAKDTLDDLRRDLSFAFMLNSAVQRSGERVTAEEIRYLANELEEALGGVYSILSQELQLPLVQRLLHQMERAKELPALPDGVVKPAIVTGLEALGRGQDLSKLELFARQLAPFGPDVLATYMNVGDYITRVGTALGIDMDGLIRSQEEIAQAEQQRNMQALVDKLGPNMINAGAKMMSSAPNAQGQPQQ